MLKETNDFQQNAEHCVFETDLTNFRTDDLKELDSAEIMKRIGEGHSFIQRYRGEALRIGIKVGELLKTLKDKTRHGRWTNRQEELAEKYGLSERTLQVYRRLFDHQEKIKDAESISHALEIIGDQNSDHDDETPADEPGEDQETGTADLDDPALDTKKKKAKKAKSRFTNTKPVTALLKQCRAKLQELAPLYKALDYDNQKTFLREMLEALGVSKKDSDAVLDEPV